VLLRGGRSGVSPVFGLGAYAYDSTSPWPAWTHNYYVRKEMGPKGSFTNPVDSCADISGPDGLYYIKPESVGNMPFETYCSDGWTMVGRCNFNKDACTVDGNVVYVSDFKTLDAGTVNEADDSFLQGASLAHVSTAASSFRLTATRHSDGAKGHMIFPLVCMGLRPSLLPLLLLAAAA